MQLNRDRLTAAARDRRRALVSAKGDGAGDWLDPGVAVGHRLKPERVLAGGNHGQGDGVAIQLSVHVLGFKPGAQPRVMDLWLSLPEIGCQATLNLQMIQLQLDLRDMFWEIATDIVSTHVIPVTPRDLLCVFTTMTYLLFNDG